MGVKTGYIILLGEFLHVPGWRLRVHRLWAVLLSEDIGADGVSCLLQSELLEQTDDLRVNVNRPHLAALRACLKTFDKNDLQVDNKEKQAGAEDRCINTQAISVGRNMI